MKYLRLSILVGLILTLLLTTAVQAASSPVVVLNVKGIINPVTADYLTRGIAEAEKRRAVLCVIQLDTPGGLDTAMRDIVQAIVNSKVPIAVYVSPSGARAASAGVFITVSAHIAAMAPDTAIGAASPVSLGSEGEVALSETMQNKVMNDAAAYIRSLAAARDRNANWAENAVREAVSATATEALDLKVIDLIAPDLDSLLNQVDGHPVILHAGTAVILHTAGLPVATLNMTGIEKLLLALSNPDLAYILLGLASLGLLVEITHPGLIFPGVVGGICLIFALFALGSLPVNIAGVLLIVLAFMLFVVEALTPATFGALTAGGVAALIVGGLILFKGGPLFKVNPWVIVVMALCIGGLFAFIVTRVIKAQRLKAATGREELEGAVGIVRADLKPEGVILVKGELWSAVSEEGTIANGEPVIVKRINGLKLFVVKEKKEGK
ncbi:MAG: nodulation protein NfeD [Dehalococcoidales bacterium]|nr:nodulation protein NfeD [Dehalococcoidales bacterium]